MNKSKNCIDLALNLRYSTLNCSYNLIKVWLIKESAFVILYNTTSHSQKFSNEWLCAILCFNMQYERIYRKNDILFGAGVPTEEKIFLSLLRNEISVLAETIAYIKDEISQLRHHDIRDLVKEFWKLKNSGARRSKQLRAREAIQEVRSDIDELISSKLDERLYIQCTRKCIAEFYTHVSRNAIEDCLDIC